MRLFVAVDVDAAAKASIAAEQSRLRATTSDRSALRWVRSEHLHLTLVFLGEIPEAAAGEIVSACALNVAQPPFDLVFGGLGVFPPRGAPRALWVGLTAGETELRALQHEMTQRTRPFRLASLAQDRPASIRSARSEQPFSPHLTLGRWKDSRPSDRHLVDGASASPLARVRIDHATLYHSRLSSQGPTYTALARANLTPQG